MYPKMDFKIATICVCCLGIAQAVVITSDYSPVAPPVYSTYNPTLVKTLSTPIVAKTIAPIYSSGPYYESSVTTHESNQKSLDGSQHSSFSKTLDTAFSKVNKFESRNDGVVLTHSLPSIYSVPSIQSANTVYHDASYPHSQPIVYNSPVLTKTVTPILKKTEIVSPALTAHISPVVSTPIISKSISTPLVYSSPIVTKTVTPVLNKDLAQSVIGNVPYSPSLAHASFSGLGASYSW